MSFGDIENKKKGRAACSEKAEREDAAW